MATTSILLQYTLAIAVVLHGSSAVVVLQDDNLCHGVANCWHNQSGLCVSEINSSLSCNHQLNDVEEEYGECRMERINPSACYIEGPSYLSDPSELPFSLQMHYYKTWMESRVTPNLTFFMPTWENVKFRYQGRENKKLVLCRRFTLANVTLPWSGSLIWDCPFFNGPDYANHSFDLSVITSGGRGGKYIFRVPEKQRFNLQTTKIEDWHVFFFLHLDHFHHSHNLPITIQLAPFKNLSYNVALTKCSDDELCHQRTTLASFLVENPDMNATTVGVNKQLTELVTSWSNPGRYAVTVQIRSPLCPEEGCFISVSPIFEIKESQLVIWLCVAFGFILMFAFAFTITLHHRTKENRKLLMALKLEPPCVLLLYLPENQMCLELVKMFATFLKETCCVHPYVVDSDVGSQNPNSWTSEHMNKASRMLFIVPGNTNGNSITPVRDQWLYALKYLSGHYFTTHYVSEKVASVLLPFSTDVPNEIAHVQRFDMIKDMTSLVTWIHSGSWWDNKLLWGPQIRSSSRNKSSCSISKLSQLVAQASQITKCHKGTGQVMLMQNSNVKDVLSSDMDNIPPTACLINSNDQYETGDSEDLSDKVIKGEDPFDQTIPDVDHVLNDDEVDDSDQSSVEYPDLDDSYFV